MKVPQSDEEWDVFYQQEYKQIEITAIFLAIALILFIVFM